MSRGRNIPLPYVPTANEVELLARFEILYCYASK